MTCNRRWGNNTIMHIVNRNISDELSGTTFKWTENTNDQMKKKPCDHRPPMINRNR